MPSNKRDHYHTLGVFRDASQEEIKRAYFEAAQRLHPDKNVAIGETELFLEIQQAYEVLSNPKRRKMYDATLPPDIETNSVIKNEILFSRPNLVQLNEPQLLYVLLEISPREDQKKIPAPPLNICLVLDRSTSMQGEKMDMVKATAIQLIRSLRPNDILSVVTFSDRAEVIIPAAQSNEPKKMESKIQMMQASGATEIYQGLRSGMDEVRKTRDPARINHIILLTDGHTYGDEQACLKIAEEAAQQNIGITGMGIGSEWNDIFLDAVAAKTGNNASYISSPKDIQRLLIQKFNTLLSIYADEILLELAKQEHVQINYAFRLQPESGPIPVASTMHLGAVLRDTPLHVLLEMVIHPPALETAPVTLINGTLKTSMAAYSTPVPPIRLRLVQDVLTDPSSEPPDTRILSALSRLTLYRMQERARTAADAGEYETASHHLHNLATHLLSQGEHSLAKTALIEADHLEKMHSWSESGSKEIKYMTRALLLEA